MIIQPLAEGLALTARCIITIVLLIYFNDLGVYVFAISYIAYSFIVVAVYYHHYLKTRNSTASPFKSWLDFLPRGTTYAI